MITMSSSASTSEIYADIDSECVRDKKNHDISKKIDIDALKISIKNILLTRKGTRRMQPEFGANLEDKLFEQMSDDTAMSIGNIIVDQINLWDPDIILEKVKIDTDLDNHLYNIRIDYSANSASINTSSIKFVLEQR